MPDFRHVAIGHRAHNPNTHRDAGGLFDNVSTCYTAPHPDRKHHDERYSGRYSASLFHNHAVANPNHNTHSVPFPYR